MRAAARRYWASPYGRYATAGVIVLGLALIALYLYVFLTKHKQVTDQAAADARLNQTLAAIEDALANLSGSLVLGGPVLQGPVSNGSLVPLYPGGDPGWLVDNATCTWTPYLSADGRTPQVRCDTPVPPPPLPPSGVVPGFYGPYTVCIPTDETFNADGTVAGVTCTPVSSLVNINMSGDVIGTNDNNLLSNTSLPDGTYCNTTTYPTYVEVVRGRIYAIVCQPLPDTLFTNQTVAGGALTGTYPNPQLQNVTTGGTFFNIESITVLGTGLTVNVTTYTDAALRQGTLFTGPDILPSVYNNFTLSDTGVVAGCYLLGTVLECVDSKGRVVSLTNQSGTLGNVVYTTTAPNTTSANATNSSLGTCATGSYATGLCLPSVVTPDCIQTVDNKSVCYNAAGVIYSETSSPVSLIYGNTPVVSTFMTGTILGGGLSLIPTGVVAGTYGGAQLVTFSVNAGGQFTAAANGGFALTNTTVFNSPSITGVGTTLGLVPTGFPAGTYTCNGQVSQTFDADSRTTAWSCVTSVPVTLDNTTTFYGVADQTWLDANTTAKTITIHAAQNINISSSPRFYDLNLTHRLFVGDDANAPMVDKVMGAVVVRTLTHSEFNMPVADFIDASSTFPGSTIGIWDWGSQNGGYIYATFIQGASIDTTSYTWFQFPWNNIAAYIVDTYPDPVNMQRWEWIQVSDGNYYISRVWDTASLTDLFAAPHKNFCSVCGGASIYPSPALNMFVITGQPAYDASIDFVNAQIPDSCLMQVVAVDRNTSLELYGACRDAAGAAHGYALGQKAFQAVRLGDGRYRFQISEAVSSIGQVLTGWQSLWEGVPLTSFGTPALATFQPLIARGPLYAGVSDETLAGYPAPGAFGTTVFWGNSTGPGPNWQMNYRDLPGACPAAQNYAYPGFHDLIWDGSCDGIDCYASPANVADQTFFFEKFNNFVTFWFATGPAPCAPLTSYTPVFAMNISRTNAYTPFTGFAGLRGGGFSTDMLYTGLGNNFHVLQGPPANAQSPLWEYYITGDAFAPYPVIQDGALDRGWVYTARGVYLDMSTFIWRNSLPGCGPFSCSGMIDQWDGQGRYLILTTPSTIGTTGDPMTRFVHTEENFYYGTSSAAGVIALKPSAISSSIGALPFASFAVFGYDYGTIADDDNVPTINVYANGQLVVRNNLAYLTLGVNLDMYDIWSLATTGQRGWSLGQLDANTLRLQGTQVGTVGNAAVFTTIADVTTTGTTHYTPLHVGANNVAQLGLNKMTVTATTPAYELYYLGQSYPGVQLVLNSPNVYALMFDAFIDGTGFRASSATSPGLHVYKDHGNLQIISTPAATVGSNVFPTTQATFTTSSFQVSPGGTGVALFTPSAITLSPSGTAAALFTATDTTFYGNVHAGSNTLAQLGINKMTTTGSGAAGSAYEVYVTGDAYPYMQVGGETSVQRMYMGMYVDASANLRSAGVVGWGLARSTSNFYVLSAPAAVSGTIVAPTLHGIFTPTSFTVSPGGTTAATFTASSISLTQTTTFSTPPRVLTYTGNKIAVSDSNKAIVEGDDTVNSLMPQNASFTLTMACDYTSGTVTGFLFVSYSVNFQRIGGMVSVLMDWISPSLQQVPAGGTPCRFGGRALPATLPARFWPPTSISQQICWKDLGSAAGSQADIYVCLYTDSGGTQLNFVMQNGANAVAEFQPLINYALPLRTHQTYLTLNAYNA